MKYNELLQKAEMVCINIDTKTDLAYVIPEWKATMISCYLDPALVQQFDATFQDVFQSLQLYVKMRNGVMNHTNQIVETLRQIIQGVYQNIQAFKNEEDNKHDEPQNTSEQNDVSDQPDEQQ